MKIDIVAQRLVNQKLVRSKLREPVEIVSWLGAVQSQDYAGAKWALNLRAPDLTDADVDRAFDEGAILRTHVLRPTWHFVAPADIRWMLALTGPRIQSRSIPYHRKLGLDNAVFARSRRVLERSLGGGKHLTRAALGAALTRAGVQVDGLRLAFLMMHAELDGVICSGPRQGKQFTYALIDERAPRGRTLTDEEALAELTRRYFASHGPATVRDYVWWSGLTVKQATRGLEMLGRGGVSEIVDGLTYWSVPSAARPKSVTRPVSPVVYLLPNYDELMNALRDRDLFMDADGVIPRDAFVGFPHQLAIDGILRGAWRRTLSARAVTIAVRPFRPLSKNEKSALADAVARYGTFMKLPAELLMRLTKSIGTGVTHAPQSCLHRRARGGRGARRDRSAGRHPRPPLALFDARVSVTPSVRLPLRHSALRGESSPLAGAGPTTTTLNEVLVLRLAYREESDQGHDSSCRSGSNRRIAIRKSWPATSRCRAPARRRRSPQN